eukprot:s2135_g16.t1
MISASLGKHSVNVDVVSDSDDGGWMVFDITATGFGSGDMFLHWGVGKQHAEEWIVPVEIQARTTPTANRVPGALQTPFPPPDGQNSRKVRLEINVDAGLKGCQFVLHKKPNEWLKNGSRNFFLDFSKVADSRGFRELVTEATKANPAAKAETMARNGAFPRRWLDRGIWTAGTLSAMTWFRGRFGRRFSFMEDPFLQGMLAVSTSKGRSSRVRAAMVLEKDNDKVEDLKAKIRPVMAVLKDVKPAAALMERASSGLRPGSWASRDRRWRAREHECLHVLHGAMNQRYQEMLPAAGMLSQALQHVMQMQAGNVQVPDATMEGDDEWANVPPIEPDLGSSRGPEPVDPRLEQLGCLQLPR